MNIKQNMINNSARTKTNPIQDLNSLQENKIMQNTPAVIQSEIQVKVETVDKENDANALCDWNLYADHVIKEEMAIGPIVLQRTYIPKKTHNVSLTEEFETKHHDDNYWNKKHVSSKEEDMKMRTETGIVVNGKIKQELIASNENELKCPDLEVKQETQAQHIIDQSTENAKSNNAQRSCEECGENFTLLRDLNLHSKIHILKTFTCDICLKRFRQKRTLIYHLADIHSDLYKTTIRREPSQVTTTISKYGRGNFVCDICNKNFTFLSNLQRHLKISHDPQAHFTCYICLKSLTQKVYLMNHLRNVHHGPVQKNKHMCEVCGKMFNCNSNLNRHRHSEHPNDNLPLKFKCDLCGKILKSNLNRHKLYHCEKQLAPKRKQPPKKKHPCKYCNKKLFIHRLESHLRRHAIDKP